MVKEDIIRGGEWRQLGTTSTKFLVILWTEIGEKWLVIGNWNVGLVKSGEIHRGVPCRGESEPTVQVHGMGCPMDLDGLQCFVTPVSPGWGLDSCWVPVNGVLIHVDLYYNSILFGSLLHCMSVFWQRTWTWHGSWVNNEEEADECVPDPQDYPLHSL